MEVAKITYPSISKYLLIGKETNWGVGTSTTRDAGLIITDITDNMTREIIESSGISSIQTQKISTGLVDPSVTIEGDIQHTRLFEPIFGAVASDLTTSDYKRTFTISNTPPSFTLESGENLTTDAVLKHTGQLTETAELGIALNENLKLSTTMKGKTTQSGTTASTAVLSTLPIFPHSLCVVSIGGTAATEVQNASITINKVVERSGGISSNLYQQGHATDLKFEFAANLGFTDVTYQTIFLGGTTFPGSAQPGTTTFEIKGTNNVDLGSGQRTVLLSLKECNYSTFTKTASVGGLIFIDMAGSGLFKEAYGVDNLGGTSVFS